MHASGQWEEVKSTISANVFHWDTPGSVIEGVFQGGEPAGPKKNMLYTVLQSSDNTGLKFWETLVLRERLDQVQPGEYVRIEYQGLRNKTKLFKVQVRRSA